jgi:hypothetical protein
LQRGDFILVLGDEALEGFHHALRAFACRSRVARFDHLVLRDDVDELFALLLQFDQKIAQLGVAQRLDCLKNQ